MVVWRYIDMNTNYITAFHIEKYPIIFLNTWKLIEEMFNDDIIGITELSRLNSNELWQYKVKRYQSVDISAASM